MSSEIIDRPTRSLKPHPLNQTIYNSVDESSVEFNKLVDSIKEKGILQPLIVKEDGTILSGHRRWFIACNLELDVVPCTLPPSDYDDRELLIDYNRYRIKTISETMREAETLETVISEKAAANRRGRGVTLESVGATEIDTLSTIAEHVGMKRSSLHMAKKVFEVAKTNANAARVMEKLDKGEITISRAYEAVKVLVEEEPKKPSFEEPDFIKHYNWMTFPTCDPRFGIPYPGRKPGQLVGNFIWMYTEEDDLVVDPMAGGGTTLDVCKFLNRECLAYDVKPTRPDINLWDISAGFPLEAQGAQLIYMDPPYWNVVEYNEEGASALKMEPFITWYKKLMFDAAKTVRIGGFVAVINMAQYFRLPDDFKDGYIDWPILTYQYLLEAGLRPWNRVASTEPVTSFTGFDMERAKEGRYVLPILYDTIIMRRMS